MKKANKYRLRSLIALFFSFLFALLLCLMLVAISIKGGLCSKQIFLRSVSNSDYYEVLYERLNQNMDTLLAKAKLPKKVGEGVLSESQVYIDGKVYITSVLEGKHPTIDTTEIESMLRANIEAYLTEQEISVEAMQSGITEIVDTVVIDYENSLQFKLADYFYDYTRIYHAWANKVLLVNAILDPILILLLLLMHRKKYHGMRYLIYATSSATASMLIYTSYRMHHLSIPGGDNLDGYYQQMADAYLREAAMQGYYISLIGAILVVVCIAVTYLLKKSKI